MELKSNFIKGFKKYGTFYGRATRAEYWTFILVNDAILLLLIMLKLSYVAVFYGFIILLPIFAVSIRRLHDTNKPGWIWILNLIPVVSIVIFIFYLLPSDEGRNDYGALVIEEIN